MKKIPHFLILLLFVGLYACNRPYEKIQDASEEREKHFGLQADSGMVVSASAIASQVGVDIMKEGGNAIDAAVAVQFALAVVYPNAGNIGGGGFMVVRLDNGEINTLDYREKAPEAASRDMYLDTAGNVIPDMSSTNAISSGVPGSVDGMVRAHEKYGKLPWKDVLQPAIDLAENGFSITEKQAKNYNILRESLLFRNDSLYAIALVKTDEADAWKAGDILIQKELAETFKLIRDNGREGFYAGATADNIVKEMKRGNGIISLDDLKNYQSLWRAPITGSYKNYRVISMPPPSSGGIALVQLLKMVESYSLNDFGWNKDSYVHLLTEVERRVYADRSQHLGDSDFYPVPVSALLDSLYLVSSMNSFNAEKASLSSEVLAGEFTSTEKEETTHFSVVDKWHNAVSVTTTLNGSFGARVFVPGSGFLLNNEMDDFSAKPGVPNVYGLVGAEANAIAPGKRMLSSMTPTIVEKDGKLFMVAGTPGGSTIITSVFQTILNVIEFDMTMDEAVNAKKFHHQWKPDSIFVEEFAIDSLSMSSLTERGHTLYTRGPIGRTDCILVSSDGKLEGGADRRGDDAAVGY